MVLPIVYFGKSATCISSGYVVNPFSLTGELNCLARLVKQATYSIAWVSAAILIFFPHESWKKF